MNKKEKQVIDRFIQESKIVLKKNIVDIIIYGSAARGQSTQNSDIDVIVIVKRNTFQTQMKLAALAFDLLLDTGEYISVQTMKKKEFTRDTIFLHNVRRDAIHAL